MEKTKEQNVKHKMPKSSKGITLIALIITIIVMLILVAVTINMAVNGGLFSHAGKAVGDMKNAIALEQELGKGRIQIGGVWYDSIDAFLKGEPSATQTKQDIIITGIVRAESGAKYIDLSFQIAGVPTYEEYKNEYLQDGFLDFVDKNVLPEKTKSELEEMLKDSAGNENGVFGDDDVVITDELKNQVINQITSMFYESMGINIVLPYEQSLRLLMCVFYYNDQIEPVLQFAILDMLYCYTCDEILGTEPTYETTVLENQYVLISKKLGREITFNDETRATLQDDADELGITCEAFLRFIIGEAGCELLTINVTVSNGDTFETGPFEPYPYQITQDGEYTFKAELQDGSGRKGETTIKVGNSVTNPYDEDGWVVAWTYSEEDGWSDLIEAGGTAEGEVVAKVYETGKTITPDVSVYNSRPAVTQQITAPVLGPAYCLVIEGTNNGDAFADDPPWVWQARDGSLLARYLVTDFM